MTAINSNRAIRGPVTAVPVVAGKGVRLVADTENNRWVVEADETVLWSSATAASTANLSETLENFEKLELTINNPNNIVLLVQVPVVAGQTNYSIGYTWYLAGNTNPLRIEGSNMAVSNSGTTLTISAGRRQWFPTTGGDSQACTLYKVVGVNRIASN